MIDMLDDNALDVLYSSYLEKLDKGEYIIPPLLIIMDIARARYKEENLDLKTITTNRKEVPTKVNDLRIRKEFLTMLGNVSNPNINDEYFIYNAISSILNTLEVVVKYPSITITNSEGKSHNIKDLFIKTSFNCQGQPTGNFTMGRSTYNYSELIAGYRHSHYPSFRVKAGRLKSWETTCLGTGTLSVSIGMLRKSTVEEFDEVAIMAYFADVDAYVAWESLEGVPYIKFSSISSTNVSGASVISFNINRISNYPPELNARKLGQELLKDDYIINNCTLLPTLDKGKPCYKLIFDEYKLVKYITSKAKESDLYDKFARNNRICHIVKDDFDIVKYYNISNGESRINDIKTLNGITLFYFKGEEVKFNAINDIAETSQKKEIVVYPEILFYIIRLLEIEINKKNGRNQFSQSSL